MKVNPLIRNFFTQPRVQRCSTTATATSKAFPYYIAIGNRFSPPRTADEEKGIQSNLRIHFQKVDQWAALQRRNLAKTIGYGMLSLAGVCIMRNLLPAFPFTDPMMNILFGWGLGFAAGLWAALSWYEWSISKDSLPKIAQCMDPAVFQSLVPLFRKAHALQSTMQSSRFAVAHLTTRQRYQYALRTIENLTYLVAAEQISDSLNIAKLARATLAHIKTLRI